MSSHNEALAPKESVTCTSELSVLSGLGVAAIADKSDGEMVATRLDALVTGRGHLGGGGGACVRVCLCVCVCVW